MELQEVKMGSLQAFVRSDSDCEERGCSAFPVHQVRVVCACACLCVPTLNRSRSHCPQSLALPIVPTCTCWVATGRASQSPCHEKGASNILLCSPSVVTIFPCPCILPGAVRTSAYQTYCRPRQQTCVVCMFSSKARCGITPLLSCRLTFRFTRLPSWTFAWSTLTAMVPTSWRSSVSRRLLAPGS